MRPPAGVGWPSSGDGALIPILREAVASARSQVVASLLTIVVVAGLCAAALLTSGRTVAAEQAALAQLDAVGTRSIVVRASAEAGLTTQVLRNLGAVEGIDTVTGFGPIVDGRNAAFSGGPPFAIRTAYGTIGSRDMGDNEYLAGPVAYASPEAAAGLGLVDGAGGVTTDTGEHLSVIGDLAVPQHLEFLEPLVVSPASVEGEEPLAMLVVLAASPPDVAAVETLVRSLMRDGEPGQITVETSAQLAAIRAAVSGQLTIYGRSTVLLILVVSAVLVAVNLFALVTMRRKDFGRRRALGASRGLIVALLLIQVLVLAVVGTALGVAVALVSLTLSGEPKAGIEFAGAVAVAGILAAAFAALPPALVAARRDPLHELRVP